METFVTIAQDVSHGGSPVRWGVLCLVKDWTPVISYKNVN